MIIQCVQVVMVRLSLVSNCKVDEALVQHLNDFGMICIYICVCIYMYTFTYVHMYEYIYIYMNMYTYVYIATLHEV